MQAVRDLNKLDEIPCRTVLTIGNFDGVHLGHREIFRRDVEKARNLKGTAVVVTFEPHPLQMLAPERAPLRLNTPEEKVRLVAASCVDLLVVLQHRVLELRRADEPALTRILDQRILIGTPTERIVVQVLLLVEHQSAFLQVTRQRLIGVFHPNTD